ncbi:hypothetical protein BOX15_Mlig025660g1 [Macrostomum lignano]|uniref:Clathrin heavy chain n=1 Tax=Macrostomum lignano TaxID=282301 RepID=A0A267EMY2_9PLAT|nr:hypothetical protein BOX15_Mlig025660g1 [Macrostomum lignano]
MAEQNDNNDSYNVIPISFQEHFQLTDIGVSQASIGFATLTMESDKYICARETVNDAVQLTIIDVADYKNPIRKPIAADSAIMCPTSQTIALRAGRNLQLYNLEKKQKLKAHVMDEDVIFWKWASPVVIGIVTERCVLHWRLDNDSGPVKVFDRHSSLAGCQIINYKCDSTEKWLVLVGIAAQQGRVVGAMQLYSVDRRVSQPLEGHAAAFARLKPSTNQASQVNVFCFSVRSGGAGGKLHAIEVGQLGSVAAPYGKKQSDLFFPAEIEADFPVAMQTSDRLGLAYVVTKFGYIHVYDLETATSIYLNRISDETIFVTAPYELTGGIIGVNRKGQVLSVSIDEDNLVPHVLTVMRNDQLALALAARCDLPGAGELFAKKFQDFLDAKSYIEAARVAAAAPRGSLRTPETIRLFQEQPAPAAGQASPLLQYFSVLLDLGRLNKVESLELCRPVLQQGRKQLAEKWLKEDKLECSEELGDLARPVDLLLALSIYVRSNSAEKAIDCFAEAGQYQKIPLYAKKVACSPNYPALLRKLCKQNPEHALQLSLLLLQEAEPPIELSDAMDILMEHKLLKECTSLALNVLKPNRPEDARLQTKILEININEAPQVADAILSSGMFTHYDRQRVANLCEKVGLVQRALEHFTDMYDIRRAIGSGQGLSPEWLLQYFGTLSPSDSMDCLKAMLAGNLRQNLQICAQIAAKYHEQLGTVQLIDLFESFKSHDGVLYYLAGVLGSSSDPEVHFRYIQAACRAGQTQELERVVRESASYEPERVKNFLKDAGLADQLPLLIVCDRFDFISDLVLHLYRQPQLHKYLEIFVQKVNPARLPEVVAALLELDCPEDTVRQLVSLAGTDFSVEALVEAAESRNRLRLLQSWLEARSANGDTQAAVHNALAKIYIDTNTGAERFLRDNQHYDSKVVGRYTEKRNPNLAVLAYERGGCADDLIRVCQENSFYKTLARFLVRRKDEALWTSVLREPSDHRRQLIDQVVQTALGETTDAEEISATVRAFMLAELPNHLLELLEKIVLDSSAFSEHRNLQNLLILTAIKADKARVMDYVTKLDNFDGPQVANLAIAGQLYEEAFAIFVKFRSNLDAAKVLIDHMADLTRAHEFAERCNEPQVWSLLGSALLRSRQLEGSVDALLRAGDPSLYREMAAACAEQSDWQTLVRYLTLARQLREPFVDSELMFGLAKTGRLSELDRMLSEPNSANVSAVADRCYAEGLYEAARRLYQSVSSFAKLAATLARLGEYPAAVEAARKANSTATWRELCRVCVETGELNLAQTCGVSLLGDADQLEQLVTFYESRGLFAEALALLEAGLGTDKAHMGVYTELAVLYTKYKPEKLRDYLDLFWSRLNIPRVIRAAEAAHLWSEAVLLYDKYEEYDSAALTMMRHPTDCWREALFKETVAKCANAEVFYKALQFYLEFKPMAINDLLMTLTPRLDHSRVVSILNRHDRLALAKPYLKSVQPTANNRQVNDALNGLYIAEEDYASLRQSVEQFANIDSLALAQKLERHELLEFRRVAALLYKQNSRYDRCLEICKADAMNKDAMLYAAESRDPALASGLLDWFLQRGDSDCYAACLYRCYDLLRPDDVLELAWKHGLTDKSMPYLIQVLHEYTKKVDEVVEELRQLKGVQGDSQLQREPMLMIAPSVVQQLPPPSPINQHQQQQQQQQPRPPQSLPTPAPPRPPAAASPTSPSGGGGGKSKPPVPPPPRSASPSSGGGGGSGLSPGGPPGRPPPPQHR